MSRDTDDQGAPNRAQAIVDDPEQAVTLDELRRLLDALRGADERHHDEDADREQHGLQDVRAGFVETEQDRERPAAGERRAEHFGADQNRGTDDGDDAGPDDLAGAGRGGLRAHVSVSC